SGFAPEQVLAEFHLDRYVHLLDRAYFNGAAVLENRTGLGQLERLLKIVGFDHRETANDVFRFRERTVAHDLARTLDHHSALFERNADILEVAAFAKFLEPREPFLRRFLHLLGRCSDVSAAE